MIDRNSCRSDAPSTRAASSRSRSTPAIPVRAERMKNGADTNVWARITATVVNGTAIPRTSNGADEQPAPAEHEQQREPGDRRRQHDRQVDDRLEPALAAEPSPGEDERERQPEGDGDDEADRGRDEAQRTARRGRPARRARSRASRRGSPGRRARATGSPRKSANRAASATSERSPQPPRPRAAAAIGRAAARRRPGRPAGRRRSRRRQEPERRRGSPARRARRTSRGRPWPRPRSSRP